MEKLKTLVLVFLYSSLRSREETEAALLDIKASLEKDKPDYEVIASTDINELIDVLENRHEEVLAVLTNNKIMAKSAKVVSRGKIEIGRLVYPR